MLLPLLNSKKGQDVKCAFYRFKKDVFKYPRKLQSQEKHRLNLIEIFLRILREKKIKGEVSIEISFK